MAKKKSKRTESDHMESALKELKAKYKIPISPGNLPMKTHSEIEKLKARVGKHIVKTYKGEFTDAEVEEMAEYIAHSSTR